MAEPYRINEHEFASVTALEAPKRYEHFIKRVADTERAYLLADDDWPVVLRDGREEQPAQLPLWPHPRYADAYRQRFGGAGWAEIDLDQLIDEVLPEMNADGIHIAVFPTSEGKAPVVPAERLRNDLLAYLDEWYGGR